MKTRSMTVVFGVATWLVVVNGCAATEPVAIQQTAPLSREAAPSSTKPAWEMEWDRTLAAAKKEGTVVLYANETNELRQALIGAMQKQYGIALDMYMARSEQVTERLMSEHRRGIFNADIVFQGTTQFQQFFQP